MRLLCASRPLGSTPEGAQSQARRSVDDHVGALDRDLGALAKQPRAIGRLVVDECRRFGFALARVEVEVLGARQPDERLAIGFGRVEQRHDPKTDAFGPSVPHYPASKDACAGITKVLAIELGPHSTRVASMSPTMVETEGVMSPQGKSTKPSRLQWTRRPLPNAAGLAAVPDDVARCAVFWPATRRQWCRAATLSSTVTTDSLIRGIMSGAGWATSGRREAQSPGKAIEFSVCSVEVANKWNE